MDWVRFGTFPLRRKLVDFDAEAPFSGEAVLRPFGARLEACVALGERLLPLENPLREPGWSGQVQAGLPPVRAHHAAFPPADGGSFSAAFSCIAEQHAFQFDSHL